MNTRKWLVVAAAGVIGAAVWTPAHAADPFYKGKTLNLIVGYSPGGGSDITCRTFANHLSQHVAGNPTIIVRNMPGAGGLKAMNYVGEAAKPDGTTALCGAVNTLAQMLGDKSLRVNLQKFNYIAGIPESQVFYLRSDVKPGIKKPADIFNAKGVIFGGFRVNSSKDLLGRPALDLLGIKYKYVTGVRGDGAGRKHIQQGFLNAWLEGMGSFISISEGTLVKTGIVTPVFQLGQADNKGMLTKRNEAVPDIPTFYELYKAKFGKAPSGNEWDLYQNLAGLLSQALRALALPPGSPDEAVAELRAGFAAMLKDDAFWSDARKGLGETVSFTSGEKTQKAFENQLGASDDLKKFLVSYIKEGEEMSRAK
jgi:tripartite-type tricarboxylate transporter receptor subunit TctC